MRGSRGAGGWMTWIAVLALVAQLGSAPAALGDEAQADLAAAPLAASRTHLEAGEFEPALAKALEALEYAPQRVELLDHASECAEQAGHADEALFYAALGLAEARAAECDPLDLDRRRKRVAKLDPLKASERPDLDGHGRRLLAIATNCVDRRLFANAVEFLHRCKGTSSGPAAEEQLESLYSNKRSLQALLDTGVDVPLKNKTSRRALRNISQDPQHESWDDAWRIKTTNYTIITNVGWELADDASRAMEQLHPFYRRVFLGKRGAGKTARCTICIYRDLDDFLDHEPGADEDTMGFFQPGENRIATYDLRTEGYGLDDLWETLFHEASHQFTDMVTTGIVPCWLNEGTAAYFEGAHIQPTGRVQANRIPTYYLSDLAGALDEGFPRLDEVVRYFEDGSYDACYYPVGWGLVYFMLNYEDHNCARVYAPLYDSYLRTYRKGGKHDSFDRFLKYFVKKAKRPGVKDFSGFEAHFKAWIKELYELELGDEDTIATLMDRARVQGKRGKRDAALETYRWVLRKSPHHRMGLLEIARLHAKRKETDAAVYFYRRLLEILREANAPDQRIFDIEGMTVGKLIEDVQACVEKLDPLMVKLQGSAEGEFRKRVAEAAARYVEADCPRAALLALDGAIRLLGRAPELSAQRRKILSKTKEDVWHWRRMPAARGLKPWVASGDWEMQDGEFQIDTRHRGTLLARLDLPSSYRIEATVKIAKVNSRACVGLLFGVGDSGILNVYGTNPSGGLVANRIVEKLVRRHKVGKLRGEVNDTYQFAVEVDGGAARFFLDGELMGERYYEAKDVMGRAGLMVENAEATFTNVRIGS